MKRNENFKKPRKGSCRHKTSVQLIYNNRCRKCKLNSQKCNGDTIQRSAAQVINMYATFHKHRIFTCMYRYFSDIFVILKNT